MATKRPWQAISLLLAMAYGLSGMPTTRIECGVAAVAVAPARPGQSGNSVRLACGTVPVGRCPDGPVTAFALV